MKLSLLFLLGTCSALHIQSRGADTAAIVGDNHFGQLGLGIATASVSAPSKYPANLPVFRQLVGGQYHTLSLSADGRVHSFGGNVDGQLGTGTYESHDTPIEIQSFGESVVQVAAGGAHSLALASSGRVFSFGRNGHGQLCNGGFGGSISMPQPIFGLQGVISVCGGWAHSAFVTSDGSVYTCGLNADGQLGLGDSSDRSVVSKVPGIDSAVSVSCGGKHTFVTSLSNNQYTIRAFGSNSHGQLCQPIEPRMISIASPVTVNSFTFTGSYPYPALGLYHSVFGIPAATDVQVMGCGSNQYGQLSAEDVGMDLAEPVAMVAGEAVKALVAGAYHTAVLTTGGKVYAMGRNFDGQLAAGFTSATVSTPTAIQLVGIPVAIGGGGGVTAIRVTA